MYMCCNEPWSMLAGEVALEWARHWLGPNIATVPPQRLMQAGNDCTDTEYTPRRTLSELAECTTGTEVSMFCLTSNTAKWTAERTVWR